MPDSRPGSGPGLLRYFKPRQHIDLLDYLAHFYIQVASAIAKEARVSNYLDRHGNLECNYPFRILPLIHSAITRYLMHVSTVNYLFLHGAGFFSELHNDPICNRESFPANNKKSMQPRKFSTANDLHYTVNHSNLSIGGSFSMEYDFVIINLMPLASYCLFKI